MAFEYKKNLTIQLMNIVVKYNYFLVHADDKDRKELLALRLKTERLIESLKGKE